jgi:hypothetical protein
MGVKNVNICCVVNLAVPTLASKCKNVKNGRIVFFLIYKSYHSTNKHTYVHIPWRKLDLTTLNSVHMYVEIIPLDHTARTFSHTYVHVSLSVNPKRTLGLGEIH